MTRAWLVLTVAGCAGPGDAARELPMHIVVTDHSVSAYMDAADITPCSCQPFVFPSVGACSFTTDAGPCDGNPYCPSCLTDFAVEQDGQRLTPTAMGGDDPWTRYYTPFADAPLDLVVAGCGHPTTRISLGGPPFPSAAVTADYVGGTAHASWTTDASSQQALVSLFGGYATQVCFVAGTSDFTFSRTPHALGVGVQPLGVPTEIDTALGHAVIWRAGDASAQFPP